MKMGETAHDLANLVQDKQAVEFGLTKQNLAEFGSAVTYAVSVQEREKLANQFASTLRAQ